MTIVIDSFGELKGQVRRAPGRQPVPEERIDMFADATDDHQWTHTDPERARSGPFGTTIAHG